MDLAEARSTFEVSVSGAVLAILLLALIFRYTVHNDPLPPYELYSLLAVLSFLIVGAYEMRLVRSMDPDLWESGALAISLLTPFLSILGLGVFFAIVEVLRNGYTGMAAIVDALGVFTSLAPFWILGLPLMAAAVYAGGLGYIKLSESMELWFYGKKICPDCGSLEVSLDREALKRLLTERDRSLFKCRKCGYSSNLFPIIDREDAKYYTSE